MKHFQSTEGQRVNVLLLKSPELKLLTDAVRPACAGGIVTAEPGSATRELAAVGGMPVYTIEAVKVQAETVTLILEEILRTRARSHWGINE